MIQTSLLSVATWTIAITSTLVFLEDTAASQPITVSFDDLLQHADRYNGKFISVRAYLVTSCPHCREFWASVKAARDPRNKTNVVRHVVALGTFTKDVIIPKGVLRQVQNGTYDGYFEVKGIFHYARDWGKGPRATGFGWSLLNDKQITAVSELRPLGPQIPAQADY